MASFLEQLFSQSPLRNQSPASLFKLSTLSPPVQKHLQKVYVALFGALLMATLGCFMGMAYPSLLAVAQLASFGSILALAFISSEPKNNNKRLCLLGGVGFFQGCALAPLILAANFMSPTIVFTALLSTATVVGCFSAAALITPRRSYLFLGGYLASALLGMSVMRLSSWVLGTGALTYQVEVYLGLLVFAAYVLFDTQLIVEEAYAGQMDVVRHAILLFTDVIAILVRVLLILMENAKKKEEAERERERRKRQH